MKPTDAEIATLVQGALTDDAALSGLVAGLSSKTLDIKQRSFLTLQKLTETHPERLYLQHWDDIVAMLSSPGVDAKFIAIYLLAGMAAADTEDRFEDIFNKYFSLLDDNTLIAPVHVALNAAVIFKAKPDLRQDIVKLLVSIDRTHHTPARKALIAANAMESLDKCFGDIEDKAAVLAFAQYYLTAPNPKARKALIAANAMESLDKCFDDIEDKAAVLDFARFYVDAPSPKARKVAKEFLKRHPL